MVITDSTAKNVLLHLVHDFSSIHTITQLAVKLNRTRVGIWKVIKKLESDKYIVVNTVGTGKTSTSVIVLNWENPLVEKALTLYLAEEVIKQRRWQVNFNGLENVTTFVILYGSILRFPQEARDIDILVVAPKKNFVRVQTVLDLVQKTQSKKIHSINFTEAELETE